MPQRRCLNCGHYTATRRYDPWDDVVPASCELEDEGGRPCVNGLTDWIPAETLNEDEIAEITGGEE